MARTRLDPAERAKRLEQTHAQLVASVRELVTGEDWLKYLRVQARFRTYSANNTLLILKQFPDATAVCGYRAWQAKGRQVRRGEQAIKIFAPIARKVEREDPVTGETERTRTVQGFRLASVFDVSQTDGEAIAPPAVRPVLLPGEAPESMWEDLEAEVERAGFELRLVPEITPSGETNGLTDHGSRVVTIATTGRDPASQARTLAHELGHALLHESARSTRAVMEVEAESVAFLIADAYGLDASSYTVPYIAAWGTSDPQAVLETARRVQQCAAAVLGRHLDVEVVEPALEEVPA